MKFDDFNNELEKFLRLMADSFNEYKIEQFPTKESRNNYLLPNIYNSPIQQELRLEDITEQIFIALQNELAEHITHEDKNLLLVKFKGNLFRLQISKDRKYGGLLC